MLLMFWNFWRPSKTFWERFQLKRFLKVSEKHAKWQIPSSDGISRQFYEAFGGELKAISGESVS